MHENNLMNEVLPQVNGGTSNNELALKIAEDKKPVVKKAKESEYPNLKIIENPIRKLPSLINELLEKNFSIILSKNGYYVSGFYGLNKDTDIAGYAFGQETNDSGVIVFFDSKGHKHIIKSFEDLVKFNSQVWGVFYKVAEKYKKPDAQWFGDMLEMGALNITPGK